jgi:flagellar hook-length control protein FliK
MIQQILSMQPTRQTVPENGKSDVPSVGADRFGSLLRKVSQSGRPDSAKPSDAVHGGNGKDPEKKEKNSNENAALVPADDAPVVYASVPDGAQNTVAVPAVLQQGLPALPLQPVPASQTVPAQTALSSQLGTDAQTVPADGAVPRQEIPVQQTAAPQQSAVSTQLPADSRAPRNALPTQQNPAPTVTQDSVSLQTSTPAVFQPAAGQTVSADAAPAKDVPQAVQDAAKPSVPDVQLVKSGPVSVSARQNSGEDDGTARQVSGLSGTGTRELSGLYSGGKVVVKISDAPKAARSSAAGQVANAVADGLKAGKQELTVDLYPESLGKVSVKLVEQAGRLTVEIAASDPKTQSLLASNSGEIKSILQSSTGQEIQITKPGQTPQWYAQDGNAGGQNARQQQQQQQERQRDLSAWYRIGGSGGLGTDDFLSILGQTGTDA